VVWLAALQREPAASIRSWLEGRLKWIVFAWAAGVFLFGLRMALGWWQVKGLAKHGRALIEPDWTACLCRNARRLGVTRSVRLLQIGVCGSADDAGLASPSSRERRWTKRITSLGRFSIIQACAMLNE
jgi:hypothetical protein